MEFHVGVFNCWFKNTICYMLYGQSILEMNEESVDFFLDEFCS